MPVLISSRYINEGNKIETSRYLFCDIFIIVSESLESLKNVDCSKHFNSKIGTQIEQNKAYS